MAPHLHRATFKARLLHNQGVRGEPDTSTKALDEMFPKRIFLVLAQAWLWRNGVFKVALGEVPSLRFLRYPRCRFRPGLNCCGSRQHPPLEWQRRSIIDTRDDEVEPTLWGCWEAVAATTVPIPVGVIFKAPYNMLQEYSATVVSLQNTRGEVVANQSESSPCLEVELKAPQKINPTSRLSSLRLPIHQDGRGTNLHYRPFELVALCCYKYAQ